MTRADFPSRGLVHLPCRTFVRYGPSKTFRPFTMEPDSCPGCPVVLMGDQIIKWINTVVLVVWDQHCQSSLNASQLSWLITSDQKPHECWVSQVFDPHVRICKSVGTRSYRVSTRDNKDLYIYIYIKFKFCYWFKRQFWRASKSFKNIYKWMWVLEKISGLRFNIPCSYSLLYVYTVNAILL